MNLINVLKLRKAILQLAAIVTDKGEIIVESELAEGVEVFVEREGDYIPAEDGEYVAEDRVIVVAEGKVVEIREISEPEPVAEAEESVAEPEPEQPEEDARIAEYEARINELEAMIAERDARIAELEAELVQKNEELRMSAELPAKEQIKKEVKTGAMRFF